MDFSWDAMAGNLQDNAFGDKKEYDNEVDTRFWKLSRDEKGDGGAIIRFLPDPNNTPFIKMTRINAQNSKKGYFVSEWSPQSIGLKCPFNEKFSELWEQDQKTKAKTMGRSFRFITNIKVIKDPSNPANEGKIFLYDMSKTMIDMLQENMIQTEQMKALDESPIAVFNPLAGNNFIVKVKNGDNDFPTYASSKFSDKESSIYVDSAAATKDILENAFKLGDFYEPTFYKTYEELTDMRDRFLKEGKYAPGASEQPQGADKAETEAVIKAETETIIDTGLDLGTDTTPVETSSPAPVNNTDAELDDLLNDLS